MDRYNTKEDVLKLGIINPELEEILQNHPLPPMDLTAPIEQLRQGVSSLEKICYDSCPTFNTQESERTIPMRDGHQSNIRIIKPENPVSASPVVVLIFGGAFIMGTNIQWMPWARAIAALYGATVMLPSYRLAPEHPFPTAPNDIWDSVRWIVANAASLDADLSQGFVIGGGSAGANLAIVTAHRARKENLSAPITGVLANVPVCMSQETIPERYRDLWQSYEQNAHSPSLNLSSVEGYNALYQQDFLSEDFSPFNSTVSFHGHPRTYVQIAGMDVIRDDGLVYAKVLRDHGVDVRLDAYPGMPHGHFSLWPQLRSSLDSQVDTVWHAGWLLGREVSREKVGELVTEFRK
ncbi:Alpha/Beta hydrolase protein [Penicillium argentinense]|uniref:Alpha/Beta hydrolase protein n=1 Tax=Penicillium argentinense TaxID=1131581 RepID=A0A9W9EZJ7_9EURO|nr:Alpha/Beta hydrolase protein [Penicillium argentinense]KAJ5090862.1 Alpha/Beta hydrolase protein [Penicillium argentinense]